MTREQQIEEMANLMAEEMLKHFGLRYKNFAEKLYEAGYRKTFTSDLASDTQKAFAKQTVKDFAEELKKKMRAYMIASGASARPWVLSADYVFSEIDCVLKEYEK